MVAQPGVALAHGLGGRADLPVPVAYFAAAAGVVVVVSFLMVSALWPTPRLQGPVRDPDRAEVSPNGFGRLLRVAGLALYALVVVAGLADGSATTLNTAPVLVLIGFWLVVPFLSPLLGDWWRWLSPWGWLSRRVNADVAERPELVARYGVLPATVSLLGFSWLELVSPDSADPRTLALAALVFAAVVVAVGRIAGPETGLRLVDGFHSWFGLLGGIAPGDTTLAKTSDRPRGWFRTLTAMPSWRGLSWLVMVLIGTVTYDGVSGTEWWIELVGDLRTEMWFETLAMLGWVVVIAGAYFLACRFSAGVAGDPHTVGVIADGFAHTLVPIALAYALAHYLTLILFEGQLIISAISDPLGRGWDLFGTADRPVSFWISPEVVLVPPGRHHRRRSRLRRGAGPRPGPGDVRRGGGGAHPTCHAGADGRPHLARVVHPRRMMAAVTSPYSWLIAHQGGWDEILLFVAPVVLAIAGVRWAEKRARCPAGRRRCIPGVGVRRTEGTGVGEASDGDATVPIPDQEDGR